MPQINNLMMPNAAPAVAANPPQTQGAVVPALSPAAQAALANPFAGVPTLAERSVGAYVGCAHPLSRNFPSLQAAGIVPGDFYLDAGNTPVKTMPLRYWLYAVTAFCTEMDANGGFIRASENPADIAADWRVKKEKGWEEHHVTVAFVDLGDEIVPAKADFRSALSGAVATPKAYFDQLADPAWSRQSDAHKVAAQFPHPFGRLYCTATTTQKTVRSGKAAGKQYHAAQATVQPTALADLERLHAALQLPEFVDQVNQAVGVYAARVAQIRAVCPK